MVSSAFQVAQALEVADDIAVDGVYLYLQRRASGALTVELREDAEGEPRGQPLATATLAIDSVPEAEFGWLEVGFDVPLSMPGSRRLWLVLRTEQADLEWAGDNVPSGGLAAQVSLDRGNSWQAHPMSASYAFRLALARLDRPLTLEPTVGEQTQSVAYDPPTLPVSFDSTSALVRGLNDALASSPLPDHVEIGLAADPALAFQVSFTRFDVTFEPDRDFGRLWRPLTCSARSKRRSCACCGPA